MAKATMTLQTLQEQLALLQTEFGDACVYLLGAGERTEQPMEPVMCWDVDEHRAFVLLRPACRADFLYGGSYYVLNDS